MYLVVRNAQVVHNIFRFLNLIALKSTITYRQSTNKLYSPVGFKVLTAVVMNVAIFWNIAPCIPYVSLCFGGMYHIHLKGKQSAEHAAGS
jgi:hypothetical protein